MWLAVERQKRYSITIPQRGDTSLVREVGMKPAVFQVQVLDSHPVHDTLNQLPHLQADEHMLLSLQWTH